MQEGHQIEDQAFAGTYTWKNPTGCSPRSDGPDEVYPFGMEVYQFPNERKIIIYHDGEVRLIKNTQWFNNSL